MAAATARSTCDGGALFEGIDRVVAELGRAP